MALLASSSQAHLLNMTEATIRIAPDGGVRVELVIDLAREFGGAQGYHAFANLPQADMFGAAERPRWERLVGAIDLRQGEQRVMLELVEIEAPAARTLADFEDPFVWPRVGMRLRGQLTGAEPIGVTFGSGFRFEEPIAVSLIDEASGTSRSRWLVTRQSSPRLALDGVEVPASTPAEPLAWRVVDYARIGFEHILPRGADHLLFVLMLLLASSRTRDLLLQVSIFTLAHSVTLILASYRVIELPAQPVEVLIACSILWVAVENLMAREVRSSRLLVVFTFGLLHGLGFAEALTALDLPADDFLVALVSFNIGVEIGQLAFMALVLIAAFQLRHRFRRRALVVALSAVTALVSLFWIAQRL